MKLQGSPQSLRKSCTVPFVEQPARAHTSSAPVALVGAPGPHRVPGRVPGAQLGALGAALAADPRARRFLEENLGSATVGSLVVLFAHRKTTVFGDRACTRVVKFVHCNSPRITRRIFEGEVRASRVLRACRDPGLPTNFAIYQNPSLGLHAISMPHCGSDAVALLNETKTWDVRLLILLVEQGYSALRELHLHQLAHRDIKPDNFAFRDNQWRIIDFGLSGDLRPGRGMAAGTLPYLLPSLGLARAQRVVEGKDHNLPLPFSRRVADIFAFGLTVLTTFRLFQLGSCDKCLEHGRGCAFCRRGGLYTSLHIEDIYALLHVDGAGFGMPENWVLTAKTEQARSDQRLRTTDYILLCAQIVLSQVDVRRKFLHWDPRTLSCTYSAAANRAFDLGVEKKRARDALRIWDHDLPFVIAQLKAF
ncbi:Protein kinase, putative [Hondaea fermentalgiana]|uniref:Protein kinase, putative n=1 Tax=Hondaea fermentalgiana TaxID=2315210 RepID=A0A2R5GFX8_9STRA|nr:Protein kinase, putative [Hondaea fermentalgiana]|eukprot:GBG29790.1 Protein kinase, putative [Hondaea fermentalgiana]